MFPRGQVLFSNTNSQNQFYLSSNAYTNADGVFAYRNSSQPATYIDWSITSSDSLNHTVDLYFDADSKSKKEDLPDPSGLDFGLPCKQIDNDEISRRLSDKEKECSELKEEHERMRLELEELRKWRAENTPKPKEAPKTKKSIISLIDDSDSEGENVDVSESKIAKELKAK
jgi:hypothetical protein